MSIKQSLEGGIAGYTIDAVPVVEMIVFSNKQYFMSFKILIKLVYNLNS